MRRAPGLFRALPLVAAYWLAAANPATSTTTSPSLGGSIRQCNANEPPPPATVLSLAEVGAHTTKADCWVVIGCGVYNLGQFVHPGGDIIYGWCGRDGTDGFLGQHSWSYLSRMLQKGAQLVGRYSAVGAAAAEQLPQMDLATVAAHSAQTDCWSCIAGTVYDLTFFFGSHPGGDHVLQPLCGTDGSTAFRKVHTHSKLSLLPRKGFCEDRSRHAFGQENALDAGAFAVYVLVPLASGFLCRHCLSPKSQDRLLRQPVALPLKHGALGRLLNVYLEMPLVSAALLVWFLLVTGVLILLWVLHYDQFYPSRNGKAGALGRVSVYLVTMATALGSRRWTLSWALWRVSYEKVLKVHYAVGNMAGVVMLVHGFMYIGRWGAACLPGQVRVTAYLLLALIFVVLPAASITNIRVRWYRIFRMTHFVAPAIMVTSMVHVATVNADKQVSPGLAIGLAWTIAGTALWALDFLRNIWDAVQPVEVVEGPAVLGADGESPFVTLTVRRAGVVPPGSWMEVNCPHISKCIGHPFTAIVRNTGGSGEKAELDFIWKVNPGSTWTQALHDLVLQKAPESSGWKFSLQGPLGGGLGSLDKMRSMVFVVGGVGVTPAASLVPHLVNEGKRVYLVWSCRSLNLIQHVCTRQFNSGEAAAYFGKSPECRRIHLTTKKDCSADTGKLPDYVLSGRPDIGKALEAALDDAASRALQHVGVFVCGPAPLVADTFRAARRLNAKGGRPHLHVHSESFQM